MTKTINLGLVKPDYDENVVSGNTSSGESNEAANEDILDLALSALGAGPNGAAVNDYTATGAISQLAGTVTLSGTGVQAMTLANPTSVVDDGKILRIVAKSAHAHTVTTIAGISSGANHKATFGGAIGDTLELEALGGVWYFRPSVNQTLSAS